MDAPAVKHCSRGNHNLPANTEHFYPSRREKDGLGCWCKECSKAASRESYAAHKAKRAAVPS